MKSKFYVFMVMLFITFGYVLIKAQNVLICQDDSSKSLNYTNECECQDQSFYNSYIDKCQNICDYYGNNICGENRNSECSLKNETVPDIFTCTCKQGFKPSETSDQNILCEVIDECSNSTYVPCDESKNEACLNLVGSYECVCKKNYTRDQNGICTEINLCTAPNTPNRCDQYCNFDEVKYSYNCLCSKEFYLNETTNECVPTQDYKSCNCMSNPTLGICAEDTNNKNETKEICYAKSGYERINVTNETYIIQDLNECDYPNLYQCYPGQQCVNKYGTYACQCSEDYDFDDKSEKCVKKPCEKGQALYNNKCTALCGSEIEPNCPRETVCVVDDNNVPFCDCQLGCHLLGSDENQWYLYSLQFIVLNDRIGEIGAHSSYLITRAIDSIFGKGNTQITDFTIATGKIEMAVGVPDAFGQIQELKESILRHCYYLFSIEVVDRCILANGIIIDMNSVKVDVLHPCAAFQSLCNHTHTKCIDNTGADVGGYKCECDSGYEKAPDLSEYYCTDIDECKTSSNNCNPTSECINVDGSFLCRNDVYNNTCQEIQNELKKTQEDLDDSEHKTKVVGGVLGAFFGLAVISLIGAGFYIVSHNKS